MPLQEKQAPLSQKEAIRTELAILGVLVAVLVVVGSVLGRSWFLSAPLPFTVVVPIAFVASAVHAYIHLGGTRLLFLLAIAIPVCFGAEWTSTHFGVPFGEYVYHEHRAGTPILDVPWTVPLAWFAMLYPSVVMANLFVTGHSTLFAPGLLKILGIAFVTGALMTIWDLALDPHMVDYEGAWTWRYSDQCQQERCKEARADRDCVRGCKESCTRPASPQLCAAEQLFSGDPDGLHECRKGKRLEPFLEECADRCRDAAPDGDFEAGCAHLVAGTEEFARRSKDIAISPQGDAAQREARWEETIALYEDRRTLNEGQNWKLHCQQECCDEDCEAGCVAAHPVRSGDDVWWEKTAKGHPSNAANVLREKFPLYFAQGYYRCIPFSNFFGWFITSALVAFLYGVAKHWWFKRPGKMRPTWIQRIPDEFTLVDPADGNGWWERRKRWLRSALARQGLLHLVNAQKAATGAGVAIYFLVAWCNVVFAYPVELSLQAVLTMGIPCLAASLRIYYSYGHHEIAVVSHTARDAWLDRPDIGPLQTLQEIEIPQEVREEMRRRRAASKGNHPPAQQAHDE